MTKILIQNGRLLDPAAGRDEVCDVLIEKGRIAKIGKNLTVTGAQIVNAQDCIVAPGLIDVHVHLREPGYEYKETLATGTRAAARGGFTSVCCMANTNPVNDNAAVSAAILQSARETGVVNVFTIGALTKKLAGKELADIGELKEVGCVALSDDGNTVRDSAVFRRGLEYAKTFSLPVISHALCPDLMGKGVMNEGFVATELGLRGIPHEAEEVIIARDLALADLTQCPVHIAHLATQEGLELVREAKKKSWPVSCEVTPHHFTLTDEACRTYDPNTKMAPPLRTAEDILALKKGLKDGTVDIIATDHAPHAMSEKELNFEDAPFGIIGLETALPLSLKLVEEGVIDFARLIELMSVNPARLVKICRGSIPEGSVADVVIFNPKEEWVYDVNAGASKSKNSPFQGWKLKGKVKATLVAGKIVYSAK